jgi:hypothetical protein
MTRILEEDGRFFPQYKSWFGWHYFYDRGMCIDGLQFDEVESFVSVEAAKSFLNPKKPVVVWESQKP